MIFTYQPPEYVPTLSESTPSITQMRDFAKEYLADLRLRNDYQTGVSLRDHEKRIERFLCWVEQRSQEITSRHWCDYYVEIKNRLKPLTVRNYFRSLEPFCRWLVERQYITTNPLEGIKPPSQPKKSVHSKAISAKGVELMLNNAPAERDRALIIFFRDTACRLSEAQAMRWENINWQKGEVYTIGKFHKPRTLYITKPTAAALRKYQQTLTPEQATNGPVWRNEKTGEVLSGSGIYQVFRRIANRVEEKVKFNPHAFRHAFGRDAVAAGISLILLKDVLGHEDIQSTMIYSEVDTETVRKAHNQFSPLNNLDAK